MLCEINEANQIEHFRPKSVFPSLLYAWENYLYACEQCNKFKGSRFPIFSSANEVMEPGRSESEPARGPAVLIDPRSEDPMEYIVLDKDTGVLMPRHEAGTLGFLRAENTIEILNLNEVESMCVARWNAYRTRLNHLRLYDQDKREGASAENLARLRDFIRRLPQVSIWREMKRQRLEHEELRRIFEAVPEALNW